MEFRRGNQELGFKCVNLDESSRHPGRAVESAVGSVCSELREVVELRVSTCR